MPTTVLDKPAAPVRIVIADDHQIYRIGLRRVLEAEPGFLVVGEATDGEQAVKLAKQLKPHVLLLDLTMPARQAWKPCVSWPRRPSPCARFC